LQDFIDSRIKTSDQVRILEVGCGTGEFAHLLKAHYQDKIDLTAIDPSEPSITAAKTKTPHINFHPHGVLDCPDATYDMIICTKSLHHCGDLQKVSSRSTRMEELTRLW
jgi:ubiquinone/menaquinone biosynthesis C-methylase UbiE